MTVRLSYQNYSLEDESHEMDRITDQRGQVTFPAQTIHASFLRRCYYTVLSARAGVHASFGPSASVFAFGMDRRSLRNLTWHPLAPDQK